jgi:fructose-specific phosphotransferase system component IIB
MSEDYPTPPPEQSLAAQAVIDATGAMGTSLELAARGIAAAALRAAADQASPEKQVKDIDYVHQMYTDGMRDALAVIQEIADELDGANSTSENV